MYHCSLHGETLNNETVSAMVKKNFVMRCRTQVIFQAEYKLQGRVVAGLILTIVYLFSGHLKFPQ